MQSCTTSRACPACPVFALVWPAALLALIYYLVRLPTSHLPLAYYDDSETLYHALTILDGRVPYRDDYSHHFMGYALPVALWAKLTGFSALTIREFAFLNQLLSALGLYGILLMFTSRLNAFVGAGLLITAREPWVLGFFQQFQINFTTVFIWYGCFRYIFRRSEIWLYFAAMLAGFGFVCDQRAALLALIPLGCIFITRPAPGALARQLTLSALACALVVLPPLLYLIVQGVFPLFIEQTFIYPRLYRLGSKNWLDILIDGIALHKYLISESPLLLIAGLGGLLALARRLRIEESRERRQAFHLVLWSIVPLGIMPFFGARDHEYYSLTWVPLLALTPGLALEFAGELKPRVAAMLRVTMLLVVTMPIFESLRLEREGRFTGYTGDGIHETVEYLRDHSKPEDELFVWGYRLDIYIYLRRHSSLPFANIMLIHPENLIEGETARLQHIYPEYEKRFMRMLTEKPPAYVVFFTRGENVTHSPARTFLLDKLAAEYDQAFEVTKPDFLGEICRFTVYRRRKI